MTEEVSPPGEGRPADPGPELPPQPKPAAVPAWVRERRVPVLFAAIFYLVPAAGAWALLHFGRPGTTRALWTPSLPEGVNAWMPSLSGAMGASFAPAFLVACGLAVALGFLLFRWAALLWSRAARTLESEFGEIIGGQRKWECLFLALLSAVAEEYVFRGWLQTVAGVWIASAAFGILHWPINRNYAMWPVFAFAAGLAFGGLTLWTGNLIAAVTAHAVYNAVALWRITDRFGGACPAAAPAGAGGNE